MMDQGSVTAQSAKPSKKLFKILLWVVAGVVMIVLVAYLGLSAYAASALTLPQRNFNPALNPGVYGLAYEDITLAARTDGLKIAVWYIPSDQNQRAILLVHGYNNSRTNGFVDKFVQFANDLHSAGFSVMMIDLRGHGQSADSRFYFGVKEQQDVLGAVDWLKGRGYQPGKIGVLGYSLSAGSVIGAAAKDTDIGAVWSDSAFADIRSVLDHSWVAMTGLPQPFLYSTLAMVQLFYGYDIAASRPIDQIASIAPRPIFMAHCQKDNLIPISHMEKLLTVAQNTQTWIIANCDQHTLAQPIVPEVFNNHAIGYALNQVEYTNKVVKFFDENLK
jgi:fermentation-respiration switch protein FrsA (DUF1100 family)